MQRSEEFPRNYSPGTSLVIVLGWLRGALDHPFTFTPKCSGERKRNLSNFSSIVSSLPLHFSSPLLTLESFPVRFHLWYMCTHCGETITFLFLKKSQLWLKVGLNKESITRNNFPQFTTLERRSGNHFEVDKPLWVWGFILSFNLFILLLPLLKRKKKSFPFSLYNAQSKTGFWD